MFEILIAFTLLIIGLVTGYALRPRIDRKISYKKRGKATRVRAAAKRAAKPKQDSYLGSNSVTFGSDRLN